MLQSIRKSLNTGLNTGLKRQSPPDQRRESDTRPCVLVTNLGAVEPIETVLKKAEARQWLRPIIVTTDTRIRPLLGKKVAFEHIPANHVIQTHTSAGDWLRYLDLRWRLIQTKWCPVYVVNLGLSYADYRAKAADGLSRQELGGSL